MPERDLPAPPYQVVAAETPRRASVRTGTLPYRPDIDGLRGLSVALVVAYHAFPNIRTGGFVGVDVFFVISGYLITELVLSGLQARTFSIREFYARRVRRIVPALLVVMTACGVLGWLLLLPGELSWLGRSMSWCASFVANEYFADTDYFARRAELNPLLHLWSLGVEEQFYIVWPVLLMLAVRLKVTMRALLAVIVISLAVSIFGACHAPGRFFFYTGPRAWELALGGVLAARQLALPRRPPADPVQDRFRRGASSIAGLALIVVGGLLWTAATPVPGIWSLIPTAGAGLLISAGAEAPVNRRLLRIRGMVFLGRISYPLYLWHWLPISFTRILLGHGPQPATAAVEMLIAFAAAYATYRWVEIPIRYGELGRKATPGLIAALTLLALTGAAMGAGRITGRLTGPIVSAWDAAVRDWRYPRAPKIDSPFGTGAVALQSHRERKALFVGDSHMQMYWPRVAHVIEVRPDAARSAVFAAYAACVPLPGITTRGALSRSCNELFDAAIERAFEPDVDTVVFGAFWESYLLGEFATNDSGLDQTRMSLELDSRAMQGAFEDLEEVVSRLVSGGRRVFIVLSNPTSPLFDPLFPLRCRLARSASSTCSLAGGPEVDAGSFESFVAPLMSRLRDLAARTGAKVLDPRATLCDGMMCPATSADGLPLYLDSNHLSGFAARDRAGFLDEALLDPPMQSDTGSP